MHGRVGSSVQFCLSSHLLNRRCQRVTLGAANLYLGQLAELHDSLGEIQDVVASLEEAIEAHEQCVVLPLEGRAVVVIDVEILFKHRDIASPPRPPAS